MHVASGKGHTDIAKLLIDNGANINSNSGKYNFTPLHLAASQGKLEIVLVLLDKGCDKNMVDSENGWTALHHASANRYSDIVSILISKGANKNIKDNDGMTYLEVADSVAEDTTNSKGVTNTSDANQNGKTYFVGDNGGCYYLSGNKKVYVNDKSLCGNVLTRKLKRTTRNKR